MVWYIQLQDGFEICQKTFVVLILDVAVDSSSETLVYFGGINIFLHWKHRDKIEMDLDSIIVRVISVNFIHEIQRYFFQLYSIGAQTALKHKMLSILW